MIRENVSDDLFRSYISWTLQNNPNAYNCKTKTCNGRWMIVDGIGISYCCPFCSSENCLKCEAIHAGKTCRQYERWIMVYASQEVKDRVKSRLSPDEVCFDCF